MTQMMTTYLLKRFLLIFPTLLGILLLNFIVIQAAPGGPVERFMAELKGQSVGATSRISGPSGDMARGGDYRAAQGIEAELIEEIKAQYGFDRPPAERFWQMLKSYARFDLGTSFYSDRRVVDLLVEKMPVSISLGLWSTLLIYLISIPLGIRKAVHAGSRFDTSTSLLIVIGYAIPSFLFAILLIVLFAGGSYLDVFPLRGIVSENWDELPLFQKILDYLWHMTLPITALVISGFATLTILTKNSFLEEIHKQYVKTAYAKGCSSKRVLYGHVFRNAMLIIIAGFPGAFIGILFTGSVLIEVIFSLDGLGLLGFEAAINRDYPVVFGTLYLFTLLGLLVNILGDLTYVLVDPRIDFSKRGI